LIKNFLRILLKMTWVAINPKHGL